MKQILATILIAALVSFGTYKLTAHDNGPEAKKESAYDRVMRTGTLRCGYAMWPPTVIVKDVNTGKLTGVMVDIVEEMAKALSLKVDWTEETGWGSFPEGLNSGRFDMFCASSYQTAARGRVVRFSQPIFYDSLHAYGRINDMRFDNGLDILNNAKYSISTMDGEISAQVAEQKFPKAKTISIPQNASFDQLLMNVSSGKADIVFNEPVLVNDFLNKNPGLLRQITKEPMEIYAVVFSLGMKEEALTQMINSALAQLQNSGMIDRLLNKNSISAQEFPRVARPYKE